VGRDATRRCRPEKETKLLLLNAIRTAGEISLDDLRKAVGLGSNNALAGVLAGAPYIAAWRLRAGDHGGYNRAWCGRRRRAYPKGDTVKPRVRGMKAEGVGRWHGSTTNKRGHQHVKTRVRRAVKRGAKVRAEKESRDE